MKDDLVSIIMPAYNSKTTIQQSIESVLAQTYSMWELLVIDDCSTDGTGEIVQQYTDSHIHYLCQKQNGGVAQARNRGIRAAEGRYLAFLDSDDLWLPEKLSHQIDFMKKQKAGFSYTEYRQFVDTPERTGHLIRCRDNVDYAALLKGNDIGCLTVMLDRKIYPEIEMPEARHEDYITWLNLLKKGGCAYALHEDLARYRKGGSSLTANKWTSLCWTWNVYRKYQGCSRKLSAYYLIHYVIKGIRKHNKFRF